MRQYVARPGQECKSELIVGAKHHIFHSVSKMIQTMVPSHVLYSGAAINYIFMGEYDMVKTTHICISVPHITFFNTQAIPIYPKGLQ